MANEQTSVPLFAASEVLTAANMNLSAGTGVPVFSNTTTRDAAFGGAGEKVLAEGQLCYLSSTNVVQYYDGAAWATVGPAASGLTKISTNTLSASSTCVFTGLTAGTTYRVVGALNGSATANILARFRETSTDKATDYSGGFYGYSGGVLNGSTGSTSIQLDVTGSQAANKQSFFAFDYYIYSSGTSAFINGQSNGGDSAAISSPRYISYNAQNLFMTACNGISILLSTGTMTGQVTIYSYA
jgi:hypothetical protein